MYTHQHKIYIMTHTAGRPAVLLIGNTFVFMINNTNDKL